MRAHETITGGSLELVERRPGCVSVGTPIGGVGELLGGAVVLNRLCDFHASQEQPVDPEERSIVELKQPIAHWSHGADSRSPTTGAQSNPRALRMR